MTKKSKEPSFSLHEFRSWLSTQQGPKPHEQKTKNKLAESLIGKQIESRLGAKRLEMKIADHNKTDIADILAEDFRVNGGKITAVNELMVNIEVDSGTFFLPKIYTKQVEG